MIRSTVLARLDYEVKAPTHFCFHIEAAHCKSQTVLEEQLTVSPQVRLREGTDEATGSRFIRLDAAPGRLVVEYRAEVELHGQVVEEDTLPEMPVSQVPGDVFPFILPSRYCESDAMCMIAQQMFGAAPPGIARVRSIVKWIHESIRYMPGSSNGTTTARDVFLQRAGVCRDFAHLGITFCRALNIPARVVAGYVHFEEPPQDFHAVFEAWLGGRWVMFDATGMAPVDRLVRIGCGQDAKDVAFATYFGDVELAGKAVEVRESHPRMQPAAGAAALEVAAIAAAARALSIG